MAKGTLPSDIRASIMQAMVSCILLAMGSASSQAVNFRGRVLERANLQPVPGATVRWEGTALSAVTGADGRFQIQGQGTPVREGRSHPEAGPRLAGDGFFLEVPTPRAGTGWDVGLECFRLTGVTLFSQVWR